MSRAAELKREGKESAFARRRRERKELEEMFERHVEETRKEKEEMRKEEEEMSGKMTHEEIMEAIRKILEEVEQEEKQDSTEKSTERQNNTRKLLGIKQPPTNKELAEQISHNTGLIGRLADQIGELTGGVENVINLVGQHDQVLGEHGRRISALEKATGILDPKPEPAARATSPDTETGAKAEPVKSEPVKTEKTVQKAGDYYGYLYFPVDKYTGKIRWDLPFHSSVDAADCKISCSWRRRLFCFNAEGKVLREATPEESSKFSCA